METLLSVTEQTNWLRSLFAWSTTSCVTLDKLLNPSVLESCRLKMITNSF